jgi:Mrp family chromosome partitioning ATPase
MNQHTPLRTGGSLLERAAELYGFAPARTPVPAADPIQAPVPVAAPAAEPETAAAKAEAPAPQPKLRPARAAAAARAPGSAEVDREALREAGFIEPDAPGGGLAEEFRIVKRQLLLGLGGGARARTILVCSARPDEGKTFCAVNLALSLAAEREREVLLIDADFPKPEILSILGLEGGAGLVDAIADPSVDAEALVVRTDVEGLSVLPAGRHVPNITELLASERTRHVLDRLAEANPRRILIFDAPPALLASPAAVLAGHAGQVLLIVRADQTTEADLREAATLLSACSDIRLLLNGAGFAATGRRFGSYYGYGQ